MVPVTCCRRARQHIMTMKFIKQGHFGIIIKHGVNNNNYYCTCVVSNAHAGLAYKEVFMQLKNYTRSCISHRLGLAPRLQRNGPQLLAQYTMSFLEIDDITVSSVHTLLLASIKASSNSAFVWL